MDGDSRKSSRQVLNQALLSSTSENSVGNQQREESQDVNWRYSDPGLGTDSLPSAEVSAVSAVPPGGADPPGDAATAAACTVHVAEEGEPRCYDLSREGSDEKDKCFPLQGGKRSTSVCLFLGQLAVGNTIKVEAWKLTRAVVHLEDAWKGRVSPCPPLEQEGLRRLFKLRWRYRWVDFLLIHLLLVLCLLEIPAWCVKDRKCFWECYPDFTRDWHMGIWASLVLEGTMLTSLVLMALVDMMSDDVIPDASQALSSEIGRVFSKKSCSSFSFEIVHKQYYMWHASHSSRRTQPVVACQPFGFLDNNDCVKGNCCEFVTNLPNLPVDVQYDLGVSCANEHPGLLPLPSRRRHLFIEMCRLVPADNCSKCSTHVKYQNIMCLTSAILSQGAIASFLGLFYVESTLSSKPTPF